MEPESDLSDFEEEESVFVNSFPRMHRISCFTHTLQLVVLQLNTDESIQPVLKKAYALVRRVNSSTQATQMLVKSCGKKLASNCPTRWSSTYILINRLLEVKKVLNRVLFEVQFDDLQRSEWKILECVRMLLQPFAVATSLISGDTYVTLPEVIHYYFVLRQHLVSIVKNESYVCVQAVALVNLDKRFGCMVDHTEAKYDPIYAKATLLHPSLKTYIMKNDSLLKSVKAAIVSSVKKTVQSRVKSRRRMCRHNNPVHLDQSVFV